MALHRTYAYRDPSSAREAPRRSGTDAAAVLGAVRDDLRQTLRTAWIDPAVEAAATSPIFFTAAWSAIRPNVGRSFLGLARSIRTEAAEATRRRGSRNLRKLLEADLTEEEMNRVEDAARAAHLAQAKAQIVVHALHRVARRERLPGTGKEEPPIRRGIPEWQRWMSVQAEPEAARPILMEAAGLLGGDPAPMVLRLLARWPPAIRSLWDELRPVVLSDPWTAGSVRLRRQVMGGLAGLPHPIELQWTALKARGFTEEDRVHMVDVLAAQDAAMAIRTLVTAFAWTAVGAPEIGVEG